MTSQPGQTSRIELLSTRAAQGDISAARRLVDLSPDLEDLIAPMTAAAAAGQSEVIKTLLPLVESRLSQDVPITADAAKIKQDEQAKAQSEAMESITFGDVMTTAIQDVIENHPKIRPPWVPRPGIAAAVEMLFGLFDPPPPDPAAEKDVLDCVQDQSASPAGRMRSEPMRLAAANGHAETVRALLPISDTFSNEAAPLRAAAENGHIQATQALADVSGPLSPLLDKYGHTFAPEAFGLLHARLTAPNLSESLEGRRSIVAPQAAPAASRSP